MTAGHHHSLSPGERSKVATRVAVVGAAVNLLLAVLKIIIGYTGRSQSLIVDGIHSLSDLLSDLLVWVAMRMAAHEPDQEHPYGHARFETAATLALGIMLVLVAGGLIWDSTMRMLDPGDIWHPDPITLWVALFSIVANEGLYWYTLFAARATNSKLLHANAWHHRSDAISSIVVLVGIGGTLLGIDNLDLVAAVVVGLMIAKIGFELGWGALQELVDASLEEETVEKIRNIINDIDGVSSIHRLRTRRQGHEALADVHIQVAPWLSVSEGHVISLAVEEQVKQGIAEIADVTVHVDPEDDETAKPCAGLPLREEALQRLTSAWRDVDCQKLRQRTLLHYLDGSIDVDLYFSLSCLQDDNEPRQMQAQLKEKLAELPEFGQVRVYFS